MLVPIILVGILGVVVGAIINVLADELPQRRPLRPPRYPDGAPRPVIALTGITAFLSGKRTSPNGFSLSWRHPLTELGTAILMIITLVVVQDDPQMTPLQFAFWLAYMAIFVLITVIDLEHRLILFVVIIPSYILALVDAVTAGYAPDLGGALLGAGLGFGVFFLLYIGGFVFTYVIGQLRGEKISEVAFGYGDVMLITLAGLILGWQSLIVTMFITVFLGAFGAILYLIIRNLAGNRYNLFTPLPYGQYIIVGAVIMLLFAPEVSSFLRGPQ